MPPSSSSKLLMASGAMLPIILVTLYFQTVIASRVVVLVGATILNLVLIVEDGGCQEVDGRFYFSYCVC